MLKKKPSDPFYGPYLCTWTQFFKGRINRYSADKWHQSLRVIHWIKIYPVDSVIHSSKNRARTLPSKLIIFGFCLSPLLSQHQVFYGNQNSDTVVKNILSPPITARYIRLIPVEWHNHISMRVEIYGCSGRVTSLYWWTETLLTVERYWVRYLRGYTMGN